MALRRLVFAVLAALVCATAVCATAATAVADTPDPFEPKNVLVLNSYHKGFDWSDGIVRGIETTLGRSPRPIELWIEYMDTKRFPESSYRDDLAVIYGHKYRNRTFDAIITSDNNALAFLLDHRAEMFPGIPVVFCGINRFDPSLIAGYDEITGIAEHGDFEATVDLIRQLHPGVRTVVIVLPNTVTGIEDRELIRTFADRLADTIAIDVWQGLTIEETESRVASLGDGYAIITAGVAKSRNGRILTNAEKAQRISAASEVPVYGIRALVLGHGAVGGKMVDGFAQGEAAADMTLDILEGKPVADMPVRMESSNRYMFDAAVLHRFGIAKSTLPPSSVIINEEHAAYQRYRTFLMVAVAVALGLSLFAGLLIFNIVRRRRAEEALRESEERLRTLIEHSPAAIYLKNLDGRYIIANEVYRNRYAASQEEIIGKKAADFLPPELAATVEQHDREVFTRRTECNWEIDVRYADGTQHTHMLIKFPMYDSRGRMTGLACVSTDITDMKKAHEATRTLQAELAHVARLSTMGEMAAGIAHELNQPLTAIGNFAAGSLRRLAGIDGEATRVVTALQQICEQAQRAGDIIRRIRLFVGKRDEQRLEGDLPEIDINSAIRGAAGLVGNEALNSGTVMRLNLSPGVPTVRADTIQIQQVIVNLARNAMEAMRDFETPQRNLTVRTGVTTDGQAEIRVLDTGPGIPEDLFRDLFEPFFTTKTSGMGMGLSICRSIVEGHNGHLTVANRTRGGAEFRIVLPAANGASSPLVDALAGERVS